MKAFLIAPNTFKGSLSATEAAKAIERGIQKADSSFSIKSIPLADGGDGTSRLLSQQMGAEWIEMESMNPIGDPISAGFGFQHEKSLAIIDVAEASGIQHLCIDKLSPKIASSYGTGLLILKAIKLGAKHIWIGLGGSASIDGGIGILQALGFSFFDFENKLLYNPVLEMDKIGSVSAPDTKLSEIEFSLLCDVDNPLIGKNGSVEVFGQQKGVKPNEIECFETRLKNWAKVIKGDYDLRDLESEPKLGAAGGIAFGLQACLHAKLFSGSDFFLQHVDFEQQLKNADILITGEGKFDRQSSQGKITGRVIKIAQKLGKQVFVLVGKLDDEISEANYRNVHFIEISKQRQNLASAIAHTSTDLEKAANEIAQNVKFPQ